MYKLYVHISPNNKMYIGITSKAISQRWYGNGSGYATQQLFWRAIQKYGWNNFQHIILFDNLSKEVACECEKYLINKYQTNNPKFGYNVSSGGEFSHTGCKLTDEQRAKLSKAHKGLPLTDSQIEHIKRLHESWRGHHHTDEVKQKISIKNKGRKRSEETRKRISEAGKGRPSPRKGVHLSEETKEKLRQANLGKKYSEETKAKHRANGSQYWKGKTRSDETKQKISETLKRRFNSGDK